jgi:hypothetical protein
MAREIERRSATGERLPRLLTPAEDWLLWRQCTSSTPTAWTVARGPLADAASSRASSRRNSHRHFRRACRAWQRRAGRYSMWNAPSRRNARAMGATTAGELATRVACLGGSRDVLLAGFERLTPRLGALVTSRGAGGCVTDFRKLPESNGAVSHASAVLAADSNEELERIADWCKARLGAQPDARLLVLVPGAPEARERLVTLIRQNVDSSAAATAPLTLDATSAIAAIEGGLPLARSPLAGHALRSLSWLTGASEFADFSAGSARLIGQRQRPSARLDLVARAGRHRDRPAQAARGARIAPDFRPVADLSTRIARHFRSLAVEPPLATGRSDSRKAKRSTFCGHPRASSDAH